MCNLSFGGLLTTSSHLVRALTPSKWEAIPGDPERSYGANWLGGQWGLNR